MKHQCISKKHQWISIRGQKKGIILFRSIIVCLYFWKIEKAIFSKVAKKFKFFKRYYLLNFNALDLKDWLKKFKVKRRKFKEGTVFKGLSMKTDKKFKFFKLDFGSVASRSLFWEIRQPLVSKRDELLTNYETNTLFSPKPSEPVQQEVELLEVKDTPF